MTNHLNADELNSYLHQTLTDAEREALDRHLADCPACRAGLNGHETLQRRIRNELFTDLRRIQPSTRMSYAAIAPRLKRSRRFTMVVKQSNQFVYGALTMALLVVVGVGLYFFVSNLSRPTPATPEEVNQPVVDPMEKATSAEFVLQFDGEPDRLQRPMSIAIDQQGNLYVLDQNNFRIQKFDRNGKPLTKWGSFGSDDGQFAFVNVSSGLAVDGQGNVYVTDGENHRIQKFDSNGQFLIKWGSAGTGDGEFGFPLDVVVDAQGNVYVLDWQPRQLARIQKFDSNGNFLMKWGSFGTDKGQLFDPTNIAVDGEGNVYIGDLAFHHIQKFDGNGNLLDILGGPGTGDGQFNAPWGSAVDGQGNLYVVDLRNQRIQKFDRNGNFLFKWGSGGAGEGEFNEPFDLVVDMQGNIYVADSYNNRIQKFRQK